jgi:hypothetical protein
VPRLVPTDPQQPGAAQDIGLEQHVGVRPVNPTFNAARGYAILFGAPA